MDFILDLSMCFRASAFSEADFSSLFSNSGSYFPFEISSIPCYWIFGFISFMSKHLLWILPFFVPQVMIEPYCNYFNAASISIRPRPPSFPEMYSLSTSALGCNILCMFKSLRVFVSIFFSSQIFQSIMPKLWCTTENAKLLTASILFLPLSSVLRINLTLLLYFFLIFSFILLWWIPSLSSTLRYLYSPSWSNYCISLSLSITIFPVEVSLPFLKLAMAIS